MQPALPIRFADFILPTVTLGITTFVWYFVRGQSTFDRQDKLALLLMVSLIISLSFMRFVDADFRLTPSRPPDPLWVSLTLVGAGTFLVIISWLLRPFS